MSFELIAQKQNYFNNQESLAKSICAKQFTFYITFESKLFCIKSLYNCSENSDKNDNFYLNVVFWLNKQWMSGKTNTFKINVIQNIWEGFEKHQQNIHLTENPFESHENKWSTNLIPEYFK